VNPAIPACRELLLRCLLQGLLGVHGPATLGQTRSMLPVTFPITLSQYRPDVNNFSDRVALPLSTGPILLTRNRVDLLLFPNESAPQSASIVAQNQLRHKGQKIHFSLGS